jgi:hypothetical protein
VEYLADRRPLSRDRERKIAKDAREQGRADSGAIGLRHLPPRFISLCRVGAALGIDPVRFLGASLRSRTALAAENLLLRKQLALYRERQGNPDGRRTRCASR